MKYKVGKSNIQGKGLLVTKPIKQGERIGIAHVNNQPTSVVGKYHNHSEEDPTAYSVEEGNKRILFATRDLNPGDEITTNYRMQPELEQPEEFKKGGSTGLPKMPKPSKKGVLAKGYSRSLEATNRVFTQNTLFEKPKSRKRKVFDPKANYALGGIPLAEYGMPMGGGISQNYQGRNNFVYQEGGEPGDKFKQRLMKRYPGMQGVYGAEGENLNIVKDPNYAAADFGYGNIEFMHPGLPEVNYPDKTNPDLIGYTYTNPSPNKYTSVYNPKGANRADIFLDMMHGMRDDSNYETLLQNFDKAVKAARGEDMQYYYEQDVKEKGYKDGQDQWNDNYVDSQLRAQLAPGSIGMFSHGRRDYRKDRRYDSPEMRAAAKDIRNYLKGKPTEEDYIEAELTPEEIDAYRKGGFIVEEVEEYQGGGQIYTYPDRPGSQYRKVNGKWEIKNKQTGWKFVPVQDPTGERTRNLNQYAVKQTTVQPPKTQQTSGGLDDYYKSALYDKVGQKAESTDTQQYVKTASNIKNAQVEAGKNRYAKDSAIRNAYRNALAADKTISQSYKDKLLKDFATYDLAKQTEVANVYLNKKANPDKVKQAVPQSTLSRAQDYLFNPFDALKASIVYGDISQLPGHYDAARKAGVNMVPRSYQERFNFGDSNIPGRNLVGDVLNYNTNFLDAAEKTYYYSRQGDGFQAVSNALRFATPMATSKAGQATWNYLGDVGDAFSATVLQKTPLAAYANKVSSPVLQTALRQASPGNVLSSYSLATGIKNLPATIESGAQYYDRGDTESFKDFANKALATGVALSPVGGQKFLTAVNPYRYAYSAGTSGYNYLKNNSKSVGDDIIDVFNIARNLPRNQFGGSTDFVDTELTDAEIQDMIDSGYVVEELD